MSLNKHLITSKISYLRYLTNNFLENELLKENITDLKTSYAHIIYALLKKNPQTMKELATSIKRDKSTLTVLAKKLEKNGYIEKLDNPADARSKFISLTKKGEDFHDIGKKISDNLNSTVVENISDEKLAIFIECLDQIIVNMEG